MKYWCGYEEELSNPKVINHINFEHTKEIREFNGEISELETCSVKKVFRVNKLKEIKE